MPGGYHSCHSCQEWGESQEISRLHAWMVGSVDEKTTGSFPDMKAAIFLSCWGVNNGNMVEGYTINIEVLYAHIAVQMMDIASRVPACSICFFL